MINYNTIYRRLIYTGKEIVIKAYKVAGITLSNVNPGFCKACVKAKITDIRPKISFLAAWGVLDFIRVDTIVLGLPL